MRNLRDRIAVVTGAASGIGAATAVELARAGCHLALVDLNEDGLAATAEAVRALGRNASTHVVDVSSKDAMSDLPDAVVAEHGAVHVLVNNAGVTVDGSFMDQTLDDFEWVVGINFWGVVYGCKFFMPHLERVDEAHIVNISSVFGILGVPNQSSYCATKYAVRGLSESLWEELRGTHIGLTVAHPGGVRTGIVASSRTYDAEMKQKMTEFFAKKTMRPERAGRDIVGAIQRGSPRLMITREAPFIDLVKRLMPVAGNRWLVNRITGLMGMNGERDEKLAERDAKIAAVQAEGGS